MFPVRADRVAVNLIREGVSRWRTLTWNGRSSRSGPSLSVITACITSRPARHQRSQFDRLMKRLDARGRAPELATPDSPTRRVGRPAARGVRHGPHAVPMLSIDNTYNYDEIREWDARVRKGLNPGRAGSLRRRAEGRRRGRLVAL